MKEKQARELKKDQESVPCQEPTLRDFFPDLLNGHLNEEQTEMVEQHIAECPECLEELSFWIALFEQDLPSWKRSVQHAG